jgi:hypothetical protein
MRRVTIFLTGYRVPGVCAGDEGPGALPYQTKGRLLDAFGPATDKGQRMYKRSFVMVVSLCLRAAS